MYTSRLAISANFLGARLIPTSDGGIFLITAFIGYLTDDSLTYMGLSGETLSKSAGAVVPSTHVVFKS